MLFFVVLLQLSPPGVIVRWGSDSHPIFLAVVDNLNCNVCWCTLLWLWVFIFCVGWREKWNGFVLLLI